jgi:hypothetical protein
MPLASPEEISKRPEQTEMVQKVDDKPTNRHQTKSVLMEEYNKELE